MIVLKSQTNEEICNFLVQLNNSIIELGQLKSLGTNWGTYLGTLKNQLFQNY